MFSRALVLAATLLALSPPAFAVDSAAEPQAIQAALTDIHLEPGRAVATTRVSLDVGLGRLVLGPGVLVPTSEIAGRVIEMVFLGTGTFTVAAPNDIEGHQLEMFTGGREVNEEFDRAVLVVGKAEAAAALLHRPPAVLTAEKDRQARDLYSHWKASHERRQLRIEGAILTNILDTTYQGFFAGWFHGKRLGDLLYLVDPHEAEPVALGQFVHLDADEEEKRKVVRSLQREQRRGRLIGLELEDLGQWNSWLSAKLPGKDANPSAGLEAFTPTRYTLDVHIERDAQTVTTTSRIELAPRLAGARVLSLRLDADAVVRQVTDPNGKALTFIRTGRDLTIALEAPPGQGETATVVVESSGKAVAKEGRSLALSDTLEWYPRGATGDSARYDVTLHWPGDYELLAPGKLAGSGLGDHGERWERHLLETPTVGYTFEIGHFRVTKLKAGHLDVTLAFDADAQQLLQSGAREEISAAVTSAVTFFEQTFGPLPFLELTVVTVPRTFSQSAAGFVTLSDLMMLDLNGLTALFGFEDRRTVVAHELAHQWWGDLVGWQGYRDQWISEAMASYCSLLYARSQLGDQKFHIGPTHGWQAELAALTADGRPVESIGPVVLGERLLSSKSTEAYVPIVYKKGAVILDMLAGTLTEPVFLKALREIVDEKRGERLSTETFLESVSRSAHLDLGWYGERYVYGTGLADVYYSYHFEADPSGGWQAHIAARQEAPYHYRYRLVRDGSGRLDVQRELSLEASVADAVLVVPVEIAVYDPMRPAAKGKNPNAANSTFAGRIVLHGGSSDVALKLSKQPQALWLDRQQRVFGRFFNESQNPKRVFLRYGLDAIALGKLEDAAQHLEKAAQAPVDAERGQAEAGQLKRESRLLDTRIGLAMARVRLAQGRDADAEREMDHARNTVASLGLSDELQVLDARLALHRGDFGRAYNRLHGGLFSGSLVSSTEGQLLLAIAAQATGHQDELTAAIHTLKPSGIDLSLLGTSH
jgi:hypothetical protein